MKPCDLCGGTDSQLLGITSNVALRSDDQPYELRQCRGCGCIFTDMSGVRAATDVYTDGYYSFRSYGTRTAEEGQSRVERPEKLLNVTVNIREVVGDRWRLLMRRDKSKEPLLRTLGLLGRILKVHLGPTARVGERKDWLYARAHLTRV
ncbi:hypothetical protein [Pyxidicoccus xibeiensis]|uniref:hypothetical protein n=1 Tax=Pyxidicoccus xibeiensis TaxID=2906759 RepID=UPI0020A77ED8|nr:hypothetical protein [Pyxidicoccus xibeiensis]MCP3137435.1 hypothetical protein [Pyxidicoccus xibeiensis]